MPASSVNEAFRTEPNTDIDCLVITEIPLIREDISPPVGRPESQAIQAQYVWLFGDPGELEMFQ